MIAFTDRSSTSVLGSAGRGPATRRALVLAAAALLSAGALAPGSAAQQPGASGGGRQQGQEQEQARPRWRVQLEMGFNGARGNSRYAILRTGMSIRHLRTETAEVELSALFRYGEGGDRVVARDWKTSIKVDLDPRGRVSPFLHATTSADAIRRVDLRSEGGAGARYRLWRSDSGSLSATVGTIFSYRDFDQGSGPPAPAEKNVHWNVRFEGDKTVGDTEFRHQTFYQPVWDQAGDYFIEMTNSVSTKLIGDLSLGMEHEYSYDATPPPEVGRTDQKLSAVFRYVL